MSDPGRRPNQLSRWRRSPYSGILRLRGVIRIQREVDRRARSLGRYTASDLARDVGDRTSAQAECDLSAIRSRRTDRLGFERILVIAEGLNLELETLFDPVDDHRACQALQRTAA